MFRFLNNIPPVTKNILLLNVLLYIITLILQSRGINLISILGAHYVNSPLFQPYQVVTHFFMHATTRVSEVNGQLVESFDFFHILFNMFGLVIFGSLLERVWGPKRFFIFYISAALGAFLLYNLVGAYDVWQLKNQLINLGYSVQDLNHDLVNRTETFGFSSVHEGIVNSYAAKCITPMVGASGAIFGIMAAFAYLFPNTEMMLMFIPFPIKAKYLVSGYFVVELVLSFQSIQGDHVAHLAHVGGAVVGFILVYIWNKNRKTFY